jgi:hypothetical protein
MILRRKRQKWSTNAWILTEKFHSQMFFCFRNVWIIEYKEYLVLYSKTDTWIRKKSNLIIESFVRCYWVENLSKKYVCKIITEAKNFRNVTISSTMLDYHKHHESNLFFIMFIIISFKKESLCYYIFLVEWLRWTIYSPLSVKSMVNTSRLVRAYPWTWTKYLDLKV